MTVTADVMLLEDYVRSLDAGPREGDYNLSIERGTAGVAYGALLLGRRFGSASAIDAAYRLLKNDLAVAERPVSFAIEDGIRHADDVRPHFNRSVIYGEPGFQLVLALASADAGDAATAAAAGERFEALVAEPYAFGEFQFGSAGALWGCALLLESSAGDAVRDRLVLRARALRDDALRQYAADDETRSLFALGEYGFAHGRAGVLFAVLRASAALESEPPAAVLSALEALAIRAEITPRGVGWPICDAAIPVPANGVAESWCNGAAGFVPLWSLAYKTYRADVFRQLAVKTASFIAGSTAGAKRNLCCGWAGHLCAYAEAHALDGSDVWTNSMAPVAQYLRESRPEMHLQTHGLLKGEAGVLLGGTAWL